MIKHIFKNKSFGEKVLLNRYENNIFPYVMMYSPTFLILFCKYFGDWVNFWWRRVNK